jgi:N-acetylmuramoyl-L-alanine amidase
MNTPNPLIPKGTLPDKGKTRFRITVLATLAVHVVLLCVLLIAGCNKKTADQTADSGLAAPGTPQATEPLPWPTSPPPVPPPLPTTQQVLVPPVAPTQQVFIPPQPLTPVPIPGPETAGAVTEHTIVKGETFATIGKKYGVGYKAIEAANPGVDPTRLKIGDKIKIPPPKSSTGAATTANANGTTAIAADGATRIYTVKSGDNLMKIAKTYGVTVKQLRAANNLRTDQIRVGQKLKIPAKAGTAPSEGVSPTPLSPIPPPGLPSPNQ